MRVAFVLKDLQLSGGVGVVVEHAAQLRRHHGIDAHLVLSRDQEHPHWPYRGLADVPVRAFEEAVEQDWDIAVATWWETTTVLFQLRAARYAYFIQLLEDSAYPVGAPERLAAAMTTGLPVRFITEARWLAEMLEDYQPGTRVHYVRNGIPKDVFASPAEPSPSHAGPLRILIEGDPGVWFKGVGDALEAVAAMEEPRHVTLVAPAGTPPHEAVDRLIGHVSHEEMAALYGEAHVVLKLSRVEGMYGPPLEGFHLGATTVTTAVTGHEEYVRHGFNGLVVGWDDTRGTSRALDLLSRDRSLLHELRWNALLTARGWPSWEQQGAVMAAALRAIRSDAPPPAHAGSAALLADVRASVQAQAEIVAERGRLRYRIAPLLALERAMERRPVSWIAGPLRRAWGRARRRLRK
jgi:glycosyltransferase involved in cell wall biosynthesis